MTLDQLPINKKAKIIEIKSKSKLRIRLLEMGLTPGTILSIIKIAPLKDPIEIDIRGYVLTLRKEITKDIIIEVL